jgi:hypothetical protein
VENDVCLQRTVENNDCSRLYSDVKEWTGVHSSLVMSLIR